MDLIDLITRLEAMPRDTVISKGFNRCHSWRGRYECLAFRPSISTRVGDMLNLARAALGQTFEGYKGGLYEMKDYTEVFLSEDSGTCGDDAFPARLLTYWLKETEAGARITEAAVVFQGQTVPEDQAEFMGGSYKAGRAYVTSIALEH